MSSIVPGYEYDIFISYRQNDNKRDGWVTNFVEELHNELDATLKNELSIYFDINPHDGLLETHQVDASLVKKLKCLVFIPIISQTYCDENSFAWQHEFLPFHKMAGDDELGINIMLGNGNVTSRILPVQIHEIDAADQQLFEKLTDGPIRAIDFIYKESGVNRSLKPEDDKKENLNNTSYGNQMNKVANAIKEIGVSILRMSTKDASINRASSALQSTAKSEVRKDKSIAVLPFTNMSSDKDQDYFCDGIAEDILNDLTQIEGINVAARTSSFALKDRQLDIREIGSKLGVTTILEGSVQKSGNTLRITVQLNNASDGYNLWSNRYDREIEDVFAIKDEIAQSIVKALAIKLSSGEKQKLEKVKTQNVEAFDFYMRGRDYFRKFQEDKMLLSIQMLEKAIEIDKNYALAYAGLADSYTTTYIWFNHDHKILEKAITASKKALELDSELAEAHSAYGLALSENDQFEEAQKEFEKAIQLNPKLFHPYYEYGRVCRAKGMHAKAVEQFKMAAEIEPDNYQPIFFLADVYKDLGLTDEMEKANQLALRVLRNHIGLNPDDTRALSIGANALIHAGKIEEGLRWVEMAVALNPNETAVLYNAACAYSLLGKVDEAINYFARSIESGQTAKGWIENDSDLDNIRGNPRFKELLKSIQ